MQVELYTQNYNLCIKNVLNIDKTEAAVNNIVHFVVFAISYSPNNGKICMSNDVPWMMILSMLLYFLINNGRH